MTATLTDTSVATAQIADACVRLAIPFRIPPPGIKPVVPVEEMIYGPVIPVRHYGSVDIFLEALESTSENGILVIDNGGLDNEACIGDLAVLEVKQSNQKAIIVWGMHRDTTGLLEIGLPVFSYGAYPAGPCRLDSRDPAALTSARFGDFLVTKFDTAFIEQDGVIFIESAHVDEVFAVARNIRDTEIQQTMAALQGVSLRQQFQFQAFLKQREIAEGYTFRQHLRAISKSIEE